MGYSPLPFRPPICRFPSMVMANVVAPPWYNGYRFVLTFIVCTSIVFNLIVKEYLTDTGSTHGKLDNLKAQRKNIGPTGRNPAGTDLPDKLAESEKQKYLLPSPSLP